MFVIIRIAKFRIEIIYKTITWFFIFRCLLHNGINIKVNNREIDIVKDYIYLGKEARAEDG